MTRVPLPAELREDAYCEVSPDCLRFCESDAAGLSWFRFELHAENRYYLIALVTREGGIISSPFFRNGLVFTRLLYTSFMPLIPS